MTRLLQINGSAGPKLDATIGAALTLTCSDASTIFAYTWELTPPPGSAAVLSSTTAIAPTFTPDLEGSYLVALRASLVAGGYDDLTTVAGVLTLRTHARIPATGETTEVDSTHGWNAARYADMKALDRMIGLGAACVCLNDSGGGIDVGAAVKVTGFSTLATGVVVPTVEFATEDDLIFGGGLFIGVVASPRPGSTSDTAGTIADGALCTVTFHGPVYALRDGTFTVGQPVTITGSAGEMTGDDGPAPIGFAIDANHIFLGTPPGLGQVVYPVDVQTTDASATQLIYIPILASQVASVEAVVSAIKSDGTEGGGWRIFGAVRRGAAGLPALVGAGYTADSWQDAGAAPWDAELRAHPGANAAQIMVTGEAGKTINWRGHVRVTRVSA